MRSSLYLSLSLSLSLSFSLSLDLKLKTTQKKNSATIFLLSIFDFSERIQVINFCAVTLSAARSVLTVSSVSA